MGQRKAVNLTKRVCDGAAPGVGAAGKPTEALLWDAAVSGFGLRVTAAGHRSFILLYRAGRGRRAPVRKWTIGSYGSPWTAETARVEARRILGEVVNGRDPAGDKSQARQAEREAKEAERRGEAVPGSVAAVVKDWLAKDQATNRDVANVRRIMELDVVPVIGAMQIVTVRKRDIIAMIDRVSERAPVKANRVLAHTKRLFAWAAGRDLIDVNPAQYVEKPAPETKRERVLADAELVEVWRGLDHCPAPYAAGIRLLILTGARLREIFLAKWPELDRSTTSLLLPAGRVKGNEGRRIFLSPQAMEIVEALPEYAGCDWLLTVLGNKPFSTFSDGKVALDRAVLAARQKAAGDGVEVKPPAEWRVHDIRRTVATGMQRLGIRLEAVEAVLGHVSGSRSGVVGVYQRHRFEDEARAAIEAWGQHVERLLDPAPAKVVPMRRKRA